jgi:RNA polymerase sigma factor (sigma-70 family)
VATFDELMKSAYGGDASAVRALHDEYREPLLLAIRKALPEQLRTHLDSGDFLQETWLQFLRDLSNRRHFESPEHLGKFLAVVAKRRIVDSIRKTLGVDGSRGKNVPLGDPEYVPDALISLETPSQSAIRREYQENLIQSLLPAHQVVARYIFEGLGAEDVAILLGISSRTVHRVRERLIEMLQTP